MEYRQSKAIYIQIADSICENILSGVWKENDRIPSIREMAVSMEVNPNTILRTYNFLQEKGIIHNRRGIGYFIAPNAKERTLELKRNEFIKKELPGIFRMMELLNIDFEHLKELYNDYLKEKI